MMKGMTAWATRRKSLYLFGAIAVLLVVFSLPVYYYFAQEPTCIDGKQNGMEEGIDCGGQCQRLCQENIKSPIVHWSRSFYVAKGVYDIVALVENPNFESGVREVLYRFKLYDDRNILVGERVGKTFIGSNEQFAVFEGGIRTGERVPKYVFFEFISELEWLHIDVPESDSLSIKGQKLEYISEKPRLSAFIVNNTLDTIKDIEVVAVLYDVNDNAIAVSATTVDMLTGGENKPLAFTWREPFEVLPVRIEIIPRFNALE